MVTTTTDDASGLKSQPPESSVALRPPERKGIREMRRTLLLSAMISLFAGCHLVQKHQYADCTSPQSVQECVIPTPSECPSEVACAAPSAPNVTINFPKEIEIKQASKPSQEPPAASPPKQETVNAVTQETLLVPRMVYVPYTPSIPVQPARLVGSQPVGFGAALPAQSPCPPSAPSAPAAAPAAAPAGVTNEQFLQLVDAVEKMAVTVKELKQAEQCKVPCEGPAASCPPKYTVPWQNR